MCVHFQLNLQISDWPEDIADHLWPGPDMPWEQTFRRPLGPAQFEIAVWYEHQLVALAVATAIGHLLAIRAIEGRPVEIPALQGQRVLIVLDAAIEYAQIRGLTEIRLKPENERLRNHYVTNFDFVERSDGQLVLTLGEG